MDHHSILTSEDSCNGKLGTFMSVDYSCILREYRLITPNGEYFCKWKINKQLTLPAKHCSKCPRVSQDEVFAEQIGEMFSSAVSKLVNRKDQLGEKGPFKQYPIKPQMGIAMVTNPKGWDNLYIYITQLSHPISMVSIHL